MSRSISVIGNVQLDVLASPVDGDAEPRRRHRHRPHRRAHGRRGRERGPRPGRAGVAAPPVRRRRGRRRGTLGRLRAPAPGPGGRCPRGRGTGDRHLDRAGGAGSGTGVPHGARRADRLRHRRHPGRARCPRTSSCSPATSPCPGSAVRARDSCWSGLAPRAPAPSSTPAGTPRSGRATPSGRSWTCCPSWTCSCPTSLRLSRSPVSAPRRPRWRPWAGTVPGGSSLKRGPLGVLAAGPGGTTVELPAPGRAAAGHDGGG